MVNSIFNLNATLRQNGYSDTAVAKVNRVLNNIMSRGYHIENGVVIGARAIRPFFKINKKSVRIMLETTEIRDEIIVSHPTNTWRTNPDNIAIGSHRVFKTPVFEQDNFPEIKKLVPYTVII